MGSTNVCTTVNTASFNRPKHHNHQGIRYVQLQEDGLIGVRAPPGANLFTPMNDIVHGKFYSVNVKEMAEWTGSQPLLIEQTFGPPPYIPPFSAYFIDPE
jgi:hypothetical protein